MKERFVKGLALMCMLAMCLGLSSCYIAPEDLSGNDITLGGNSAPFPTWSTTQRPTTAPTATPTATPGGTFSDQPNLNWNDDWGQQGVTLPQVTNASGMIQLYPSGVGQTQSGVSLPGQSQIIGTTNRPTATLRPTATPAATSLKLGASGTTVRTVQQRLKNLGYYDGTVDGDFGEATENAVKAFQRQNGLTVDGKVGSNTLARLNSSSAKKAPTPTPSGVVLGASNDNVRAVQQRLKELGYYTGSVDGVYGEGTDVAVRAFQRQNGLTVDGKVGSNTLAKLNSSSAVKAPTPTPRATATPNLTNARYLEIGSSGSDVRRLQTRLISLGWLDGTADGEYGGATEAAVRAFQNATSGLWDDGIAGPDTQRALYANNARSASSPSASIGETLELGSEGAAVKALQKRLRELGYLSDSADGTFGQATKAAVIAFQTVNKLTVDGKAGTATLNKLYSPGALPASAGLTPTRTPAGGSSQSGASASSTGYTTLRQGDESSDVERLQRALKNLGYYTGSVDGKYGAGTTEAVKVFQRINRITVDGTAGPQTQRMLYGTSATSLFDTIRPGDQGSEVTNLQYTLYELGYYDGTINGIYNELTKDAVRAFQIRNEVTPVDGIAGNKTLQALYSSDALSATAVSKKYDTLRRGDFGNDVVEMQDCLKQLGYLGTITGEYDEATYWAVKSFQERHGISADGVAGNETLMILYSDSAKRAY